VPNASFRWESRTLPNDLREAFSKATCNGCHGGERTGDPLRFQHLAPFDATGSYYGASDGETRVSRQLHDPSGGDDELGKREKLLARALCGACNTPSTLPPGYR
jgi:cytochrome c peroxidase